MWVPGRFCRAGSSPRVRGKRVVGAGPVLPCRLIPARAGKTPSIESHDSSFPAHPRACGENDKYDDNPAIRVGSSPRVRGKLMA